MSIPAAWHPDPTGRHEYRYWDGQQWTEHVANQGQRAVDPLDGRPAPQQQVQQPVQQPQAEAAPAAVTETQHHSAASDVDTTDTSRPPAGDLSPQAAAEPTNPASDLPVARQPQTAHDAHPQPSSDGAELQPTVPSPAPLAASPPGDGLAQDEVPLTPPAQPGTTATAAQASAAAVPPSTVTDPVGDSTDGEPSAPGFQAAASASGPSARSQTSSPEGGSGAHSGETIRRSDALGNGPSVAALLLGIVAAILALVPFVGLVSVVLGSAAVVLGIIGRRRGRRTGMGKGTATTGLITGVLGIVLAIVITILFVTVVRNSAFGMSELVGCLDQGIDAATCSRRFERAFFDQLFGR